MNGLPPGPPIPALLQTALFFQRQIPFLERCARRYGDIFTLKIAFTNDLVVVTRPETIKQVFSGDPKLFHAGQDLIGLVVGPSSLFLLDEDAHLHQRRLMLPAFHGERMKVYGDLIASIAERELEDWPENEPFALHPRTYEVTQRVILRAVFGLEDSPRLERLKEKLAEMLRLSEWLIAMPLLRRDWGGHGRWARFKRARAEIDAVLLEEIAGRRAAADNADRTDVLSMIVEATDEGGGRLSDSEIRDALLTLLVAGSETTATSLAWALERLMRHPEQMSKLKAELEAGGDDYLEAIVQETLRLRPVVHFAMRRLTAPVELQGFSIPADMVVGTCIYLTHVRPDLYPDPYSFRPERFLGRPPETYSWVAFGGGVRRCLGAAFATFEMKTVLRTILSQVELTPADPAPERQKRHLLTFVPSKGAQAVARRRRLTPDREPPARAAPLA